MGNQFLTGIWGCDLKKSSDLPDNKKEEYNKAIEEKCNKLIKIHNIEIFCNQFRGDGRLIVFGTKDMQANLFRFAVDFCTEINKDKEEGKLVDFYIRTYIHIGTVNIDGDKAVGTDINELCKLLDNKDPERLDVSKKYSSILICTSECFYFLNEKDKKNLSKYTFKDKDYYICEFQPSNLVIHLLYSDEIPSKEILSMIQTELKKQDVKIVNTIPKSDSIIAINDKLERIKIYNSLKQASETIAQKANKNNWKGQFVILIDLEASSNPLDTNLLLHELASKVGKRSIFSNFIVWSDVSLDEFKKDDKFSKNVPSLTKYAFSENMRIYSLDFSNKKKRSHNIIFFSNLDERCVYLHSFDYGGIKLIKSLTRIDMHQYLRQQLEMGLILNDSIIIHSAEVFRSNEVYDVLYEYMELIKNGSIKLLFSSKVNDIKRDFENYIEDKIKEYGLGKYGDIEVSSLENAKKEDGKIERTIELLSLCPNMIKRDGDGTSSLEELINEDFRPKLPTIILETEDYARLDLLQYNYSLYQLLNAKYVENDAVYRILPAEITQDIIEEIEQLVNGVISASIMNRIFEDKIPREIRRGRFKRWFFSLIYRSNFLYAQINTGKFLYAEYLPNLNRGSLFDYYMFYRSFQDCINVEGMGCNMIMKIRESGEKWEKFKLYYLNAHLLKQIGNASASTENYLYNKLIKNAHEQLKSILDEE